MNIDKIREKVDNLKNRTVENGATKEEAETALKLAQKLINKYGLEKPQAKEIINQEIRRRRNKQKKFTKPKAKIFSRIFYFYLITKCSSIILSSLLISVFR